MTNSNREKIDSIRESIIQQISSTSRLYGMSQTMGHLMATIHYNQKPMTLDEMSEKLGMTKMSMSNAIREMLDMGIAEKVFNHESRKDLYTVQQDDYEFFIQVFCATWRKATMSKKVSRSKMNQELQGIIDTETDEEAKKEALFLLNENKKALAYFDWLNRLIVYFETFEIFDHVPQANIDEIM